MTRVVQDSRWRAFSNEDDLIEGRRPSTIRVLRTFSRQCLELLPPNERLGSASILRVARSLFVHSWFDVDFLPVTCLVSQQAVEAALHELYPETASFKRLLTRAERAGVFSKPIAAVVGSGIDIRDALSHPLDVAEFSPSLTASMLIVSHRLVVACWMALPRS